MNHVAELKQVFAGFYVRRPNCTRREMKDGNRHAVPLTGGSALRTAVLDQMVLAKQLPPRFGSRKLQAALRGN